MNKPTNPLLFWTPRVLGILFAAFITLFAADALEGVQGFWNGAMALAMHLVPTAIILLLLAIAWRWEWIGAALFTAAGAFYVIRFWGRFHWSAYALIAGPLLVMGIVFFVGWVYHTQMHRADSK